MGIKVDPGAQACGLEEALTLADGKAEIPSKKMAVFATAAGQPAELKTTKTLDHLDHM